MLHKGETNIPLRRCPLRLPESVHDDSSRSLSQASLEPVERVASRLVDADGKSPSGARKAGFRVFYALHHRYRPGDYDTWKYIAPIQKAALSRKTFENGTRGGEIRSEFAPQPGDIVAQEHSCSSGFANTDLDLLLKKHGIHKLIVIGLIAHTCIESNVRFAAELGYDATVVKDAIARLRG
jgi:nicotinamidase-related amidase